MGKAACDAKKRRREELGLDTSTPDGNDSAEGLDIELLSMQMKEDRKKWIAAKVPLLDGGDGKCKKFNEGRAGSASGGKYKKRRPEKRMRKRYGKEQKSKQGHGEGQRITDQSTDDFMNGSPREVIPRESEVASRAEKFVTEEADLSGATSTDVAGLSGEGRTEATRSISGRPGRKSTDETRFISGPSGARRTEETRSISGRPGKRSTDETRPMSGPSGARRTEATRSISDRPGKRSTDETRSVSGSSRAREVDKADTAGAASTDETGLSGLVQPQMDAGHPVTGATKDRHRLENKRRRGEKQMAQGEVDYWSTHGGNFRIPTPKQAPKQYKGQMCPSGLALHHPASGVLLDYAMGGCPVNPGTPWTADMMEAAVLRGPHKSALEAEAMAQLATEVEAKAAKNQVRVVLWDDIKHNPPPQLKISPIAMIPHKSRKYRAILDLSFSLRLEDGTSVPSVNEASVKTAPRGAIDQMGHTLQRIIHAFAQADPDAKIFMAKWDIKDGFWRLDCAEEEDWNFCYVLPQPPGEPIKLVVPKALQMGWIESPPYFCAASETGRDVATQYAETPIGTLRDNKFIDMAAQGADFDTLPAQSDEADPLRYLVEVYVDDFISLAMPRSQADLRHVANAVMNGIHDVFPADESDDDDAISLKKLLKLEGMWAKVKDILGFTFDGVNKTIWLEAPKRDALLTKLTSWLRHAERSGAGIPFDEFQSIIAKLRHAFISIPSGLGLLSPCNEILRKQPAVVYIHSNRWLTEAIAGCKTILRESTLAPTKCTQLVPGWPDYVGIVDASGHGVGGVIVGENKACTPTVFRYEWPPDIKQEINSEENPTGKLTNSDLECAGLLLLYLVMEDVCDIDKGTHVALFSDNSPTVHWVRRLASKSSRVAGQLIRALALRLGISGASPLTTLHIPGDENGITDIPSRSFGEPAKWHCNDEYELLTLFQSKFPLPDQQCWTVYQLTHDIFMRVLSVLRMEPTTTDEWRRLPRRGRHIGSVGKASSNLWESTLTFRGQASRNESEPLQDSPGSTGMGTSAIEANKSELRRLVAQSRPLERRALWPMG